MAPPVAKGWNKNTFISSAGSSRSASSSASAAKVGGRICLGSQFDVMLEDPFKNPPQSFTMKKGLYNRLFVVFFGGGYNGVLSSYVGDYFISHEITGSRH